MNAIISQIDCFGKVKITFSNKISIYGIKFLDINSSNTDIRIIPFVKPEFHEVVNLTKYNMTWNTTKLTEYVL